MANIADLIANRNQELEDFKQKKQEERTEAYERRDAAVMEVTSDPEKYRAFLDLHAQTMYNAANTATVWKQRPGATQLLPRKKWAELGRKIREDETPVQVFMRDTRSGYIKLDYVYDKAQTVGDPVPVRGILRDGTPDMEKALGALLQSSPVEVVATADIFGEAEYQPEENRIASRTFRARHRSARWRARSSMRRSEQGWRRAILTRGPMSWMRTAYVMRCADGTASRWSSRTFPASYSSTGNWKRPNA